MAESTSNPENANPGDTDSSAPVAEVRNARKQRVGVVSSDKMNKTITVRVERRMQHPLYGKYITRHKKLTAHDENNDAGEGDLVRIMETRPLSKQKRWRLIEIIQKAE